MEKRNTILLAVIAIATLLVAVVGATFAYFASNINTNSNIGVNVKTSNNTASFVATTEGNIDINVASYMMQQGDAGDGSVNTSNVENIANNLEDNASINVTLTASESGNITECSYDIIWVWEDDSTDFTSGEENSKKVSEAQGKVGSEEIYPSKYYIRSENVGGTYSSDFKEFTIEGTQSITNGEDKGNNTHSGNLFDTTEKNLDTFKYETDENSKKMILKTGEKVATDGTISVKYDFIVKFYNLPSDQSSLMGKNFKAHISIDNVVC